MLPLNINHVNRKSDLGNPMTVTFDLEMTLKSQTQDIEALYLINMIKEPS